MKPHLHSYSKLCKLNSYTLSQLMCLYILQCKANNNSQITTGQFLDIVVVVVVVVVVLVVVVVVVVVVVAVVVIKCLIN